MPRDCRLFYKDSYVTNKMPDDQNPEETGLYSPAISPVTPLRSNSYIRPSSRPTRRRRGRPAIHWTQSNSRYNRRRNNKRLRRSDVEKLKAADAFASRTGQRLETFVTVRWLETTDGEENIQPRWGAFLTKFRNWMQRRGIPLSYVYVHENPPHASPGFNTHLLVNVPPALRRELESQLLDWFVGSRRAIDVRPRSQPGYVADDRLSYMLKGTDKYTAIKYRLINGNGWDFDQGVINFKRCGVSNNLNAAARTLWRSENDS